MEYLFILGLVMVVIVVAVVKNVIDNKNLKITKQYSHLYAVISSLNIRYNFNSIDNPVLKFDPKLKSKRALENFDIYKYISDVIESNQSYFALLFYKIDENIRVYREYQSEYEKIEKYTTKEEFDKFKDNIKLKYKTFLNCEKVLYKRMKLEEPIIDLSVECHATYTSPTGRNHYWRDASYSFYQLKQMLKNIELRQQKVIIEKERKEKLAKEKREKERRLMELDRLEAKLTQKEKEITKKEQEFIEATKGHIYTADKFDEQSQTLESNKNLSLSQQLKLIREKYENGEITYAEYQSKRRDLM